MESKRPQPPPAYPVIEEDKVRTLVDKHFGKALLNKLGYTYSEELKTVMGIFVNYKFNYTNDDRMVAIWISNDDELLQHRLHCLISIHRLPNSNKWEDRIDPEYFYHATKGEKMEYGKYNLDQTKDYLEELNRVMEDYAKLLFTTDLLKVIKGKKWYENMHVTRD